MYYFANKWFFQVPIERAREAFRDALGDTKDFPMATGGFINWQNPPGGDNQTPPFAVVKVVGKAEPEPIP